jgi:hypothetical protein
MKHLAEMPFRDAPPGRQVALDNKVPQAQQKIIMKVIPVNSSIGMRLG